MAYIDSTYYSETFRGREIPASEFPRLADIASDFVYGICYVKPNDVTVTKDDFKRAVAYQVELLYEQGGVDTILGRSEASQTVGSESLSDYSVSAGGASKDSSLKMCEGIPISPMAYMKLEQLGLMCRWAYAEDGST